MTAKRKTMAGMGKGVDAFFAKPEESVKDQDDLAAKQQGSKAVQQQDSKAVQQHSDLPAKQQDDDFERATFYIRPEQQTNLEELRIGLRKHKVKTNKSELIRTAIDLLAEQSIEGLARKMARRSE
jgi:hypothetical protein